VSSACAWGEISGRESLRRTAFLSEGVSTAGLYLSLRGFFPPDQVMELAGASRSEVMEAAGELFGGLANDGAADAHSFNYVEVKRYLHDQLLRDADVFSMAHSIELRVPLLHQPVLEAAAGASTAEKRENGFKKPLLVRAVDDPVVREAALRPKRGFSFPMQPWMRANAGELEGIPGRLDTKAVRRVWSSFAAGRMHWSRAWAMVVLAADERR
jgi:asparagine synthase (glutamine-hydrolysing)